jgi:MinD superfamily P-loop ATPase
VRAVRKAAVNGNSLVLLDAAPGTSCPVIAAAHSSDFLLLVTEPTPLGLSDLEAAVRMGRAMRRKMGLVINRVGEGDASSLRQFADREQVPVLASIPFDRAIATAYARGQAMVEALPGYRVLFEGLWRRILEVVIP